MGVAHDKRCKFGVPTEIEEPLVQIKEEGLDLEVFRVEMDCGSPKADNFLEFIGLQDPINEVKGRFVKKVLSLSFVVPGGL